MSEEEILAAAEADPDARPLTSEDFARMRQTPCIKIIRRTLGLSREAFAARYGIPLGTIEAWEDRSAVPDEIALSYLRAIAGDPAGVAGALEAKV